MTCSSVSQAAHKSGVSRSTIIRWMADSEFQRFLSSARRVAYGHSLSRLIHLSSKAVTTLADILDGKKISKDKFLAAKTILEFCQSSQSDDVEDRLAEVEERLNKGAL